MIAIKQDERGTGHLEAALIVVVVAIIGFVGWYVYHAKQNTDRALNTTNNSTGTQTGSGKNKTQPAPAASTSNASLQSDLQAASSAANQGNKDMSTANTSLGDQSTFTSVPQ
jgi:uncharacterized protein HemX